VEVVSTRGVVTMKFFFKAICISLLLWPISAQASPKATYLGSYTWTSSDPKLGGLSGLEISEDGTQFFALSDRATLFSGAIARAPQGKVRGLELSSSQSLKGAKGEVLSKASGDAEGLALSHDGALYMSFENDHRVALYDQASSTLVPLEGHEDFARMQRNSSLEALAIDDSGAIYLVPERSGHIEKPFPVYRFIEAQGWEVVAQIPRYGDFLPVGADIGPDGHFYLLERWFSGVGFATRVSRARLTQDGFGTFEEVLRTSIAVHDNLEGISVWKDDESTRITLVSDDNFMFFQRTEFVDYRVYD